MKNLLVFLLFLTAGLYSCENTNQTEPANSTSVISKEENFSMVLDSLLRQGGGPCESDFDCMKVKAVWPVVKGGKESIRKILNDSISKFMINHMDFNPEMENISLSTAMNNLIEEYAEEFKNQNTYGLGWSLEAIGKIEFHKTFANLQIDNYSFFGGAHPNYHSQYTNFDTKTGKVLSYSDVVQDMEAFKKLAEEGFANAMKEKTGEDEYLYLFGDSGFSLGENFKLGKEAIEILYNPYEAGPYVLGSTEVILPYSELKDIIKL